MRQVPLLMVFGGLVFLAAILWLFESDSSSSKSETSKEFAEQKAPINLELTGTTRRPLVIPNTHEELSLEEQWKAIKPLLLDRKTRGVGIGLALEVAKLPHFFLDQIDEDVSQNPAYLNPLGQLLAVQLESWMHLPGETEESIAVFLSSLFELGIRSESISHVAALAWKGRRTLQAEDLALVQNIRPEAVDDSPLLWRTAFFLLSLEDIFHALLELGEVRRVERYLEDPSQKVRLVALRVLFEGKPSAEWASILSLLDDMDFQEVVGLAEWIAETQDPQVAAELLQMISMRLDATSGFLAAWAKLGARDRSVLEWTLRSEFDELTSEQISESPSGFIPIKNIGELNFLYHEGALRKEVMDAYFVNSMASGEAMDSEMLNWLARLDQNPLTRGQAWRTLGRSADDANLDLTLNLLYEPGYLASLRLPGEESDQRAADFLIQYVAPRLEGSERNLLLAQTQQMLLSKEERESLVAAFSK